MEQISLAATVREVTGSSVTNLRRAGTIPAVLYGPQHKSTNIAVSAKDFEKAYRLAGGSSLIDLTVADGKPIKVLAHDIQSDPVSGEIQHIDFYQVDMKKKTTADVGLEFIGESKAVKELGGVLVKGTKTVTIECLPQHLIQHISVDINSLNTFDDIIRIQDLPIPEGVVILDQPSVVVASVQKPRTEAELKALEEEVAAPAAEEAEQAGEKEKAEGEETAEAPAEESPSKEERKPEK